MNENEILQERALERETATLEWEKWKSKAHAREEEKHCKAVAVDIEIKGALISYFFAAGRHISA